MAFDFPSSPTTGQTYSVTGGPTYVYNGTAWVVLTPGNQFNRTVFTATAGQTTFSMNYVVGAVDVYRNGVKLAPADFTATNGTSIVLANGCTVGDTVEVISYPMITYSDAVKRTGDTMTGNLTVPMVLTDSSLQFRNRIINGDMRIDQRYNGASATYGAGTAYVLDRWLGGATTANVMNVVRSTDAPEGFTNSLRATSQAAYTVVSGSAFYQVQVIEGFNIADFDWGKPTAKAVTVSFWVKSSVTGTHSGSIRNTSPSLAYPFTYAINAANTWEYKTVTIPGPTTGTWTTDNTAGLWLFFDLGSGSSLRGTAGSWQSGNFVGVTGAVTPMATSGATWFLTGVQLEVGSVATSFERRPYGLEELLCQRFFERGQQPFFYMNVTGVTFGYADVRFSVTKRASPTIVMSGFQYYSGGSASSFTPILNAARVDKFDFMAQSVTNFNGWPGTGTWTASAEF